MFSRTTNFEELNRAEYKEIHDDPAFRQISNSGKKYSDYRQYASENRTEIELANPTRRRSNKKQKPRRAKTLRGSEVGCCTCAGDVPAENYTNDGN